MSKRMSKIEALETLVGKRAAAKVSELAPAMYLSELALREKGLKSEHIDQILAALSLGAGLNEPKLGQLVREPEDVVEYLSELFRHQDREMMWVVYLDHKHRIINYKVVAMGTISQAAIYPREIVKGALINSANAVILAHNHPSGESKPSTDDRRITLRLRDALHSVDIKLLDHLVIGSNNHVSLARLGWL